MISLPKADKARTRRLETGEKERLLQGASPKLQHIIILTLKTGMRRGEILNIKKNHIDFNKFVLFIPSTKTDTPSFLPSTSSEALAYLRGQPRASQSAYKGVHFVNPLFLRIP
jgi:integrase